MIARYDNQEIPIRYNRHKAEECPICKARYPDGSVPVMTLGNSGFTPTHNISLSEAHIYVGSDYDHIQHYGLQEPQIIEPEKTSFVGAITKLFRSRK